MTPALVIVNGRFGSGKTYMAERLAADLKLPLFNRDGIKETAYDALKNRSEAMVEELSPISHGVLLYICEQLLKGGVSHVLESNFSIQASNKVQALLDKYQPRAVQVHLWTTLEVSLKRSLDRIETGDRHPVHQKERQLMEMSLQERIEALTGPQKFMRIDDEPLKIDAPMVQVDTNDFGKVDYPAILNEVSRFIRI